ncbi:MAG: hypothetical protein IPO66_03475 [Rhodanobacteraceae bacterium]|nr:hypothetical protein [Rhodanobacteraceae bacterium]
MARGKNSRLQQRDQLLQQRLELEWLSRLHAVAGGDLLESMHQVDRALQTAQLQIVAGARRVDQGGQIRSLQLALPKLSLEACERFVDVGGSGKRRAQRRIQFVGDATDQTPQCRVLFRLHQLPLGGLQRIQRTAQRGGAFLHRSFQRFAQAAAMQGGRQRLGDHREHAGCAVVEDLPGLVALHHQSTQRFASHHDRHAQPVVGIRAELLTLRGVCHARLGQQLRGRAAHQPTASDHDRRQRTLQAPRMEGNRTFIPIVLVGEILEMQPVPRLVEQYHEEVLRRQQFAQRLMQLRQPRTQLRAVLQGVRQGQAVAQSIAQPGGSRQPGDTLALQSRVQCAGRACQLLPACRQSIECNGRRCGKHAGCAVPAVQDDGQGQRVFADLRLALQTTAQRAMPIRRFAGAAAPGAQVEAKIVGDPDLCPQRADTARRPVLQSGHDRLQP